MKMAHTRANLGILSVPSVSSVSSVVHKNPFLLGKDLQISSIDDVPLSGIEQELCAGSGVLIF